MPTVSDSVAVFQAPSLTYGFAGVLCHFSSCVRLNLSLRQLAQSSQSQFMVQLFPEDASLSNKKRPVSRNTLTPFSHLESPEQLLSAPLEHTSCAIAINSRERGIFHFDFACRL